MTFARRSIAMGAAMAVLAAVGAPMSAWSSPANLRQTTMDAQAALARTAEHTAQDDGFFLDDKPGSPAVLEAQWAAVRKWSEAWLEQNAKADPGRIVEAAKEALGLEFSASRLSEGATLVTASNDAIGTAFVLKRTQAGQYALAWALDEPSTWGNGGPAALQAWRSDHASFGCRNRHSSNGHSSNDWGQCGPLAPSFVRLADEVNGTRRFAIVGGYSQEAGATEAFQISIWRWDGHHAEPLLAHTFAQMVDEATIADVERNRVLIHEKGELRAMFACGGCSGRQMETSIELPPTGARLGATRSLVGELDLVDALYDRLLRSQPADDLATREVIKQIEPIVETVRDDARKSKAEPSLGMLDAWKSTSKDGDTVLCLSADYAPSPQLFTIAKRAGRLLVTDVQDAPANACEGADARS